MTRATKVMLEQYETQIESLKANYAILRRDLASLDKASICYETNAINILMRMKETRDEYRTMENIVLGIEAANSVLVNADDEE